VSARARATFVLGLALVSVLGYGAVLHHGYPVGDWLFWRVGVIWLWGLFLSAACVSIGHRVLGHLTDIDRLPTLEALVNSAALGLLVFVAGMYFGGFARQYNAVFAVMLPTAMLAGGARSLGTFARARHAAWKAERTQRDVVTRAVGTLVTAFGFFGLVWVYFGVMTPASVNFDASWSHLPIAADYARAGRIVPFDGDYTRNFPHLASIVHTWAMIVPSGGVFTEPPVRWMLALHLEFLFFVWTLAGVGAVVAWLTERDHVRGAWAAFFLFPAIFVYDSNLGGAADHYLAFFAAPFFLAAVRAAPRFAVGPCLLAGAYAGGALLTKYQAVYLIVGVGGVFALLWVSVILRKLRARAAPATPVPTWAELARGPLALVLALAAVTSPHFLKNWVFYRNPAYPFMQDVFASRPTTPHAAYLFRWLFQDYNWQPHGTLAQNVIDALRLCLMWCFHPHYSFTHDVPDGGALFTLCLPMGIAVGRSRRIGLGYAAALGSLFAWAMILRVDRHLQTFMPLVVAVTAAVIVRAWELGWIARAGLVLLVSLQAIWGGDAPFYSGYARFQASIDLIRSGYEGHASTRFAGFHADERAIGASLPESARVVLHTSRPNLGIDRDLILDWAGQQGLILYEDLRGPRGLFDFYKSIGVTHLLWLPGRRAASTKQEDVLFSDFVHRFGRGSRRFGEFELVALPSEPPPADHPYHVLSLGLAGYADGLYPVEAMKAYEDIPGDREKFAPPEVALPSDPVAQVELATRADAVCLAERFHPDPRLASSIGASFELAVAYARAFAIHVRRADGDRVPERRTE
jgi:hypothetical protein